MPNDPSKLDTQLVFDTQHPLFLLAKLKWEIEQLSETRGFEAAFVSLNCAITAWHVTDWIWQLSDEPGRTRLAACLGVVPFREQKNFAAAVQDASEAIAVCRQLATAAKHLSVNKFPRVDLATTLRLGDGEGGDIEGHFVQINDGGKVYMDRHLYPKALEFWLELYTEARLLNWEQLVGDQGQLKTP